MAKEGDPPVSMNAKNIESAIYGAASHTLGLENRKKLGGLTRDMAAAIYLYTMDTNFYKIINALLRDDERDPLKPFFPYLKLVMTGLRRLEKQETEVYRGVALPLSLLDGAEHYIPGNVVVWWPFSSSSVSRDVLADPLFLGTSGKRTLFTIKVSTARDIRAYSWKAKENELLILPGTPFKVASVDTVGDLTTIHLEEDVDAPDMIDSGDDTYEMVDFKDAQEGFYDLAGDAYDAIEDDSGGGGAADAYDLVADQRVGVDSTQDLETTASWYVGSMKQSKCDSIVSQAGAGCFLVRESSQLQGNKFILSVNYQGKAKNFEIVGKKEVGANGKPTTIYVFSGKKHASLELVVDYSIRHSISKSGEKIPLTESAISAGVAPWDYRGKPREEWRAILGINNVPGYFVIRDTDKAFCALTLLVKDKKLPLEVTHWSQLINQNAQGEFKLKGARLRFSTLPGMIAAYRDPKTCEKQKKKDVPVPLQGHLASGGGGAGSC